MGLYRVSFFLCIRISKLHTRTESGLVTTRFHSCCVKSCCMFSSLPSNCMVCLREMNKHYLPTWIEEATLTIFFGRSLFRNIGLTTFVLLLKDISLQLSNIDFCLRRCLHHVPLESCCDYTWETLMWMMSNISCFLDVSPHPHPENGTPWNSNIFCYTLLFFAVCWLIARSRNLVNHVVVIFSNQPFSISANIRFQHMYLLFDIWLHECWLSDEHFFLESAIIRNDVVVLKLYCYVTYFKIWEIFAVQLTLSI